MEYIYFFNVIHSFFLLFFTTRGDKAKQIPQKREIDFQVPFPIK